MRQNGRAIGRIAQRYRAILRKCRLLNAFGALAVTGLLVTGMTGMPYAGPATSPWNQATVSIGSGQSETVSEVFDPIAGQSEDNITTTSLTLETGGSLVITNGANLTNGNLSFAMQGGTLTLEGIYPADAGGQSTLQPGAINGLQATISGGGISMTGGQLRFENDIRLRNVDISTDDGTSVLQSRNGTIYIEDGTYLTVRFDATDIPKPSQPSLPMQIPSDSDRLPIDFQLVGKTVMRGGSITVDGSGVSNAADVTFSNLEISGGTITIANYGRLWATEKLIISDNGKLINNVEYRSNGIWAELLDMSKAADDAVENTGRIDVVTLICTDAQLMEMTKNQYSKVNIQSGGTISLYGESAVLDADRLSNHVSLDKDVALEAGKLTLQGNSLNLISGKIRVDSLSAGADVPFDFERGTIVLRGGSGSTLNGNLTLNAGSAAAAELRLGEYNAETSTLSAGGTLAADISAQTGTVTVAAGEWTQNAGQTLSVGNNGALNVGGAKDDGYAGQSMPATLIVRGSLQSTVAGNSSTGINVLENGILEADKSVLLNGTVRKSGLETLYVGTGGTLLVKGLGTVTKDELEAMKANLMSGGGTFDIFDATVEDAPQVNPDGTIDYKDVLTGGFTSLAYQNATVINVDGPLSGNFAAVQLAAGGTLEVDSGTTLILNGSKGGNLIVDSGGGVGDITTAGAFYMGESGKSGNGVIGNVVLDGDAAAITAWGSGEYSGKTVTTTTANKGAIIASGTTLTFDAIGTVDMPVGSAEAVEGKLVSKGDIYAEKIVGWNGTVLSEGSITAGMADITGGRVSSAGTLEVKDVAVRNGILEATGDLSITGPVDADDSTFSNGIIRSTSGSVTLKDDVTLKSIWGYPTAAISAAKDIVLEGEVNASSLLALQAGDAVIAKENLQVGAISATTLKADKNVSLSLGSLKLSGTGSDESNVGGDLRLSGTRANVGDMQVTGNLYLKTSDATFGNLEVNGDIIRVGEGVDTVGSTLRVTGTLDLDGSVLAVDPAWGSTPSNVAVNSINDDPTAQDILINGGVAVGQNSYAAIGTDNAGWLPSQVPGGLSPTGTTAALGIFKPVTVAAGQKIYVNGALVDTALVGGGTGYDAAAADSATFTPDSLLVINGTDADILANTAAITFANAGTVTAENGARLAVMDAVANRQYSLFANATGGVNLNGSGWQGDNLLTSSRMVGLAAQVDAAAGTVTLTAMLNDARTAFPGISDGMARALNLLYTPIADQARGWIDRADVDSPDAGIRFLSRATDIRYAGDTAERAVRTIESAARMAVAGAVPQMLRMAADAGTNAVVNRLGLANPADGLQTVNADGKLTDRHTTGLALWIAPTWQNRSGYGQEAGNLDGGFNGNIGGVALGADYTFANAIRTGITLSLGGGYAESAGDFAATTNSMSYWGVGLYAGWSNDIVALMADVSYTASYNKLKQELDPGMQMRDLRSDVQASAWQAGLRAEYRLETSVLDIIPHAGVRYMNLRTWGHDVKSHERVLSVDEMNQDIWTFPVGVTLSKDVELGNGWYMRPSLDFTVIPAAGDIKGRQDVRFAGLPGVYEVENQVMDYLTWQGGVGLEFGTEDLSLGVNYTVQTGQTGTGHGIFASFRYEF